MTTTPAGEEEARTVLESILSLYLQYMEGAAACIHLMHPTALMHVVKAGDVHALAWRRGEI